MCEELLGRLFSIKSEYLLKYIASMVIAPSILVLLDMTYGVDIFESEKSIENVNLEEE